MFLHFFSLGGAYLVGPVDDVTDEFCGKNVIYLYPDLKTAIAGRFDSKFYYYLEYYHQTDCYLPLS